MRGCLHCRAYRQFSRLQSACCISRLLSSSNPLPSSWFLSASSRQLVKSQSLLCSLTRLRAFYAVWLCFPEGDSQLLLQTLAWRGSNESCQFQGLPEIILSHLLSVLKNLPAEWNVSMSEEMTTPHTPTLSFSLRLYH